MNALDDRITLFFRGWTDGPKFLLATPDSPPQVLNRAYFVGSEDQLIDWVRDYPHDNAIMMIDATADLICSVRELRPELDISSIGNYK